MKTLKTLLLGLLALTAVFGAGCGHGIFNSRTANQAPVIQITAGAVRSSKDKPLVQPYSITFQWSSFDPDGFVDHYEYATSSSDTAEPTGTSPADTAHYRRTTLHQVTAQFPATQQSDSLYDGKKNLYSFTSFREFFVRAVDNDGRKSEWDSRFFNALTVAPLTSLTFPRSGAVVVPLGPSVNVRWTGTDLDATDPKRLPVKYLVWLRDITPAPATLDIPNSDRIIRETLRGAPVDTLPQDTTRKTFKLTPGRSYCLIVKAIDEAGALEALPTELPDKPGSDALARANYSKLGKNVAIFTSLPSFTNPSLSMFVGSQSKTFSGYNPLDPLRVEIPTSVDVGISWFGDASGYGSDIANYSYALDIDDPTSANPRVTQTGGYVWTSPDTRATSAVVTGYKDRGVHNFFVRVFDDAGSRTIGIVQLTVVPADFKRPLLYVMDDPNAFKGGAPLGYSQLTTDEHLAYWRDILETDRYFVDLSEDPAGKCQPVALTDSFAVPSYNKLIRTGIPLSVLLQYRVLVWYCTQSVTLRFDSAMHKMASGGFSGTSANNFFTYLQAGGNVWLHGGGVAGNLANQRQYPMFMADPTQESRFLGPFMLDALGLRGPDTLISSDQFQGGGAFTGTNYDGRLRAIDPYPGGFKRQTAFGLETRGIPSMLVDLARFDTLPSFRINPATPRPYWPGSNEILSTRGGFPTGWKSNPDSATWQPLGVFRPVGPGAVSIVIGGQSRLTFDGCISAWYKKGTTIRASNGGAQTLAPYQLFYFGSALNHFERERVRELADIILSTKGWNIWRGSCPVNGALITRERDAELQGNIARMPRLRPDRPATQVRLAPVPRDPAR